jgi:RNA polymerase sigma-70 factor (ECF subfamily)
MGPRDSIQVDLLTARAQLGDHQAFEHLVHLFHAKVSFFVRKMLLKKDLADDVMQDVWMTVHRKLPTLRATQAFPTWLYRIARSETVQLIRMESHYVELDESEFAATTDDPTESELEFPEEDIRLLNLALDRIPIPQREAIVLRFMDEMSYEEIAAITDQPLGTVRSRIHLAKKALKKEMEALGHGKDK